MSVTAHLLQRRLTRLGAAIVITVLSPTSITAQAACSGAPLAVQVLGSGGPHPTGGRASSGYLVWRSGRAVVMVDAGGGTFLRFGEAGARLQDLSLLAISHLHPDHVSDLPALLWLSEAVRQQPLKLAGPTGAGPFPAIEVFVKRLFDSTGGAFPILSGTLGQTGQGVRLDVVMADATIGTATTIWSDGDLEVSAIGVPHGPVPTLGYRVRVGDRVIVFGSDQNGTDERFSRFAAGADALVMHFSLSQQAPDPIARLHARPATVGQIARSANPKRLILSHFIEAPAAVKTPQWFSLSDLARAVAEVRTQFAGEIDTAADLQCFPIR